MDLLIFDEHQAVRSKAKLLGWCSARIRAMRQEIKQAESVIDDMHAAGLVTRSGRQLRQRAVRRLGYYESIQAAVSKGYLIVPALPIDAFIIRSQAHPVAESDADPAWPFPAGTATQQLDDREAVSVRDGESFERVTVGDDHNVFRRVDGESIDVVEVQFPISMCRPTLIPKKATEIQRMLFDRIGVQFVPVRRRP